MNKIEQLIDIYIKERQKLLDKIIWLVENEKPWRIWPYEKLIENIDKQINHLQSLQEPTEEREVEIDELLKEPIIKAIEQWIWEWRKLWYAEWWNDCIMKKEYKYKEITID